MLKQIIKAIYLTFENVESLYEDATILKSHSKFGRAYTLFSLSFEEAGRFYILYNMLMDYLTGELKAKDINYGKLKKLGYENHILKISESYSGMQKIATILTMIERDQNKDPNLKEEKEKEVDKVFDVFDKLRKSETDLNELKNVGLYVTFKNNEFRLPDKTITASQFIEIENLAKWSLGFLKKVIDFAENKGGLSEFERLIKEETEMLNEEE
nr:AbiV family abortive infection protein [uncultured Allomuricauda sp.]